jgi:putative transposase
MCSVFKVHKSGFYAWLANPFSKHALKDKELSLKIHESYHSTHGVYGSPRVFEDLKASGVRCGRKRIERLMRANGLRAVRGYKQRRFKYAKPSVISPNLVERNFITDRPDKVWSTDITYIRCQWGWAYLAAIMDIYSRKIVGWSFGPRMTTDLVLDALHLAIKRRDPAPGLILHSDQGSQYGSQDWRQALSDHGISPSMSRRGNCYDNAVKESFFSSLKMERVRRKVYLSLGEARSDLFDYIEMFYNPVRRHSYLKYVSPCQFERNP